MARKPGAFDTSLGTRQEKLRRYCIQYSKGKLTRAPTPSIRNHLACTGCQNDLRTHSIWSRRRIGVVAKRVTSRTCWHEDSVLVTIPSEAELDIRVEVANIGCLVPGAAGTVADATTGGDTGGRGVAEVLA